MKTLVIICMLIAATAGFCADNAKQAAKLTSKEYRKQLLERLKSDQEKQRRRENDELKNILTAYRQSKNEDEKQKNYQKLTELTKKQFYRRLTSTEKQIKIIEKRLDQLKKRYNTRKENADKIINQRVEQLTSDPALKW